MRENAQMKGKKYVAEARLLVDHVADGEVRARCKGDGAIYRLGTATASGGATARRSAAAAI